MTDKVPSHPGVLRFLETEDFMASMELELWSGNISNAYLGILGGHLSGHSHLSIAVIAQTTRL